MHSLKLFFCLWIAASLTASAQTETTLSESRSLADFWQDAKHPVSWFNWGGDLRVRNEYYASIVTLAEGAPKSEQDVIRFRGRVWGEASATSNLVFYARLAAEPREWLKPSFIPVYGQTGLEWRYGIFDNLYVQWKEVLGLPLTIKAGRQDIMLYDPSDCWLIAEGTPVDGSWSIFLDSVRATLALEEINTKLDLIGIYQNPMPDAWLPTLGDSDDYPLTDQRETGLILYASNKSLGKTVLDAYFIYKHDDQEFVGRGDNADLYTPGAKATIPLGDHWRLVGEGAYQFGWKEDRILGAFETREVDAYAAKARLTYAFNDPWKNELSAIAETCSGDDPSTPGTDEMFDTLWGRWPRWSELYIYSYVMETSGRIAQVNNVDRIGFSWTFMPWKTVQFSSAYSALFAPEDTATRALNPTLFSGDGNFRGHYLQTFLKWKVTRNVASHLWGEWVWEGDYYAQRDTMAFLRAEVSLSF